MFDLPNPIGMYEQAKNAGLAREIVEDVLSQAYSDYLTTRWTWRTLPIIGNGIGEGAIATLVSLRNSQLYEEGKIRLTVPKSMLDPDLLSKYQTEYKEKK